MKKDSEWFDLNIKKKVGWLSEPLKGKMKGIQEAAKLFEMSFKYPEYDRLTILELIDKLKESDEEIIENAAWMLLKLVKLKPKLLFENLKIIKGPIKIKNKKIRIFLGSIIKELAQVDSSKIQTAIPQVIDLLDDSNEDVKLLGSQIFLILSKTVQEKIEVSKQLALLNEKNNQIRLNAIETLMNISDSKTIIPLLFEQLFILVLYPQLKARVFNLIFQLINKKPEESLKHIIDQIFSKKIMIRKNALIFLTQYQGKNSHLLCNYIKELADLLFVEEFNDLNIRLLFLVIKELAEFYPNKFHENEINLIIKSEKKFKKDLREDWIYTLLNVLRNQESHEIDLESIKKFLEKRVKKAIYTRQVNVAVALNRVMIWNDDYGPAIKMLLNILDKNPLDDNGKIYFWIGFNYHVIGDFKTSLTYFRKGIKSKKVFYSSLNLLHAAYDMILEFKLKNAKDLLEEHAKRFDSNLETFSQPQMNTILKFHAYLRSIISLDFSQARMNLQEYLASNYFKHPWEKRYCEVEFKNTDDLRIHYQKLEHSNG